MNLIQINPTRAQLAQLSNYPKNTPVVMVNILKFRPQVAGSEETGAEAYARYFRNVQPFVESAQIRLIWKGRVVSTVIGDSDDPPDMVFLAEYPSVAHFLRMLSDPAYQQAAHDRSIALEYGGLLACQSVPTSQRSL